MEPVLGRDLDVMSSLFVLSKTRYKKIKLAGNTFSVATVMQACTASQYLDGPRASTIAWVIPSPRAHLITAGMQFISMAIGSWSTVIGLHGKGTKS